MTVAGGATARTSAKEMIMSHINLREAIGERMSKWGMPTVRVYVTLKPSLLDSAGRTVSGALQKLGYSELEEVRIGKLIELQLESYEPSRVKEMCDKLLANPVIENYRIEEVVA